MTSFARVEWPAPSPLTPYNMFAIGSGREYIAPAAIVWVPGFLFFRILHHNSDSVE